MDTNYTYFNQSLSGYTVITRQLFKFQIMLFNMRTVIL